MAERDQALAEMHKQMQSLEEALIDAEERAAAAIKNVRLPSCSGPAHAWQAAPSVFRLLFAMCRGQPCLRAPHSCSTSFLQAREQAEASHGLTEEVMAAHQRAADLEELAHQLTLDRDALAEK